MAFDPSEYLGAVLPALIASREAPGPLPTATLQFLVPDAGVEIFYRLSPEGGLEASTGLSDTQDLTLVFQSADLEAFSRRALDFEAALTSRRLKVHGDTDLLGWLADHLAH